MIAASRNRWVRTFCVAVAVAALATAAWAGYPNYPPQPTVTEYAADPAWPKRPA